MKDMCQISNQNVLGDGAFMGCCNLTSTSLPSTLKSIGKQAFCGCSSLVHVHFGGTMKEWAAVLKGDDWDKNTGSYVVHCIDGDVPKGSSFAP